MGKSTAQGVSRNTSILSPQFSLCEPSSPNTSTTSPKVKWWRQDVLLSQLSIHSQSWRASSIWSSACLVPHQKISRGRRWTEKMLAAWILLGLYSRVSGFVGHSSTFQLPHNSLGQTTSDRHCIYTWLEVTDSLPLGDPAVLWTHHCNDSIKGRAGAVIYHLSITLHL